MAFKVGDKVRHHRCDNESCSKIGLVGVITRIGESFSAPGKQLLAVDNEDDHLVLREDSCELVDPVERLGTAEAVRGPGLPSDAKERKALPLCTGVLDYFPDALAAVAECSRVGNEQHNPGQPLHWAKEKSTDEADALLRHLVDRGKIDSDGVRHSAKVAWRALANLQREIEAERKS